MSVTRLNISLEQYEIGLSGAVPDRKDWTEPAMDRGILEFVALFSGLVFKYGGRIVHGCHPTFTPVILRQARLQATDRIRKPVTLVMSDLWARHLKSEDIQSLTDVAEFVITKKVGSGSEADRDTRNRSLTAMRRVLIDAQNVMVAIAGLIHSGDGLVPGVDEEMKLAKKKGIPRFLIGGLGGYASKLTKRISPSSLNNFMLPGDNAVLFSTKDIASSVNLLFEHIARSDSLARSALQPIKWNYSLQAIVDHRDGTVDRDATGCILRSEVA